MSRTTVLIVTLGVKQLVPITTLYNLLHESDYHERFVTHGSFHFSPQHDTKLDIERCDKLSQLIPLPDPTVILLSPHQLISRLSVDQ